MGRSTVVLRQSQLSTSGDPAGLTVLSSSVPFSMPNKSFPISFTLLSICFLWDIASKTCFSASFFRGEPSGALRNCQWTPKILNISGYFILYLCITHVSYIGCLNITFKWTTRIWEIKYRVTLPDKEYLFPEMDEISIPLVDCCWRRSQFQGVFSFIHKGNIIISRICTQI